MVRVELQQQHPSEPGGQARDTVREYDYPGIEFELNPQNGLTIFQVVEGVRTNITAFHSYMWKEVERV